MNIEYKAVLHSTEEKSFCERITKEIGRAKTPVTNIRFVRQTKSYGSTSVFKYKVTLHNRILSLHINLGRLSGGNKYNPDKIYKPDFNIIKNIKEYVESEKIKEFYNKHVII